MVDLGPMAHNLYGGYYDVRVKLPDGRNHCVATAEAVREAILSIDSATKPSRFRSGEQI